MANKTIVDVRTAADLQDVDTFVSPMSFEDSIKNKNWQSCQRYTISFREIGENGEHLRYHCVTYEGRLHKGRNSTQS